VDDAKSAADLRSKAAEMRRLASVPPSGGHRANRLLIQIAERLEYEAQQKTGGQ
jgi:hypothetical protein